MKTGTALVTMITSACSIGCGPLIADSGFDLWCGDSLCNWKTEEGTIQRVPTWHEKDYGVELVDTPTVISQAVDPSSPHGCMKFAIIADVTAEAETSLEFDFFSDGGAVDHAQQLPGVHWQRQEILVKLPYSRYAGLTIKLDKKGNGRAAFAELSATFVENCHGDAILLEHFALGARCGEDAQCDSGACTAAVPAEPAELTCTASP